MIILLVACCLRMQCERTCTNVLGIRADCARNWRCQLCCRYKHFGTVSAHEPTNRILRHCDTLTVFALAMAWMWCISFKSIKAKAKQRNIRGLGARMSKCLWCMQQVPILAGCPVKLYALQNNEVFPPADKHPFPSAGSSLAVYVVLYFIAGVVVCACAAQSSA